ncbi:unnamed protein product [Phaedon cochleariae]|uniref:Uncharacterized protein n=1 Tax=Phaedon cochleariae TaxID=80249 RepID=A0A9P0DJN1_PHACE|nr:unnamed protein product [Phaedon cochleariae]
MNDFEYVRPGRPANVDKCVIRDILLQHKDQIIVDRKIVPKKYPVWSVLSRKLDSKISAISLYVMAFKEKENLLSEIDGNSSTSLHDNSAGDSEESLQTSLNTSELSSEELFCLEVPAEDFENLLETRKSVRRDNLRGKRFTRTNIKLKKGIWQFWITNELWLHFKVKCGFNYEYNYVTSDTTHAKIKGHCDCGNIINVDLMKQSDDKVRIECRITNIFKVKGICGKRYLREPLRTKMVEKLKIKSTVVFRSEEANKLMEEGDVEPPHLYRAEVLSTAKNQIISKTYLSKNPITALHFLKVGSLQGSIHNIGLDPFFVHFWSIHQQHIYRSCMKNDHCAISIDATGSIIKKNKKPDGSQSNNIFLYNAVMYTRNKQIPIFHMLTEKHNTNMISYWLGEWLRSGNPLPVEVICDSSIALLTACTRVFTGFLTISDYVDALCTRHIACYIRIDVAHFIKMYAVFLKTCNKSVKSLYLGIIGQIIMCKDENMAKTIIFHLLLISKSKRCGNLPSGEISRCSTSKKYLKSLLDPNTAYDTAYDMEETGDIDSGDIDTESILFNDNEEVENIWLRWGSQIDEEVKNVVNQENADDDNAHFLPQFSEKLLKSLRWFPLWSNIYHSKFKSARVPASSAPVEGEFNIVKNHVFKMFPKPIRPDVFVEKYSEYMKGKCKIIDAELTEIMDVDVVTGEYDPDETSGRTFEAIKAIQEVEDWGGLATAVKSRGSRYLTKNYDLFQATNENKKLQKIPIMKNGNISSLQAIKFKKEEFSFGNTCAFDSLLQIFLVGVFDHPQLREVLLRLQKDMKFAELVLYISNNGINQHAYRLRGEILKEIYKESTNVLLENHYLVNCESNIITVVTNIFGNLPSIQEAAVTSWIISIQHPIVGVQIKPGKYGEAPLVELDDCKVFLPQAQEKLSIQL